MNRKTKVLFNSPDQVIQEIIYNISEIKRALDWLSSSDISSDVAIDASTVDKLKEEIIKEMDRKDKIDLPDRFMLEFNNDNNIKIVDQHMRRSVVVEVKSLFSVIRALQVFFDLNNKYTYSKPEEDEGEEENENNAVFSEKEPCPYCGECACICENLGDEEKQKNLIHDIIKEGLDESFEAMSGIDKKEYVKFTQVLEKVELEVRVEITDDKGTKLNIFHDEDKPVASVWYKPDNNFPWHLFIEGQKSRHFKSLNSLANTISIVI